MFELKKINDKWFYSDPPLLLRFFTVFVWGDVLVILPFVSFIALLGLLGVFDRYVLVLLIGVCLAVRSIGEMTYWLLQQFGPKIYRPKDFGFTTLGNNAIYILYQLFASVHAAIWVTFVLYLLFVL